VASASVATARVVVQVVVVEVMQAIMAAEVPGAVEPETLRKMNAATTVNVGTGLTSVEKRRKMRRLMLCR
jgi:hypothetical protein